MCFTIVRYKTPSAVGSPHLVRRPRFIYESMFYTKPVMLGPRFIPQSVFCTQSAVHVLYWLETYDPGPCKSTQTLPELSLFSSMCFLSSVVHCYLRNIETEDKLVYQSNPVGFEHF